MTRIVFKILKLLFILTMALYTGLAFSTDECKEIDKSDAIVIMVCPPTFSQDVLSQTAELACGSKTMCNVWIWDEEEMAPKKAPSTDAELPKDLVPHARVVWANDVKSLLIIKKVTN